MPAQVDTRAARVIRAHDGIIEVRIRKGAVIELPEIEAIMGGVVALHDGYAAILVDARAIRSMSRAALDRTANHPLNDVTVATALLVSSPVSVLLGNFHIRLARPPYPSRLFREEPSAREWLVARMPEKAR